VNTTFGFYRRTKLSVYQYCIACRGCASLC